MGPPGPSTKSIKKGTNRRGLPERASSPMPCVPPPKSQPRGAPSFDSSIAHSSPGAPVCSLFEPFPIFPNPFSQSHCPDCQLQLCRVQQTHRSPIGRQGRQAPKNSPSYQSRHRLKPSSQPCGCPKEMLKTPVLGSRLGNQWRDQLTWCHSYTHRQAHYLQVFRV